MKDSEKKKLLLITDNYPFGLGDSFLFTEIEFLCSYFSVTVVTTNITDPISNAFKDDFQIHRIDSRIGFPEIVRYTISCLFEKLFWKEIFVVLQSRDKLFQRILQTFNTCSKAKKFALKLNELGILSSQEIVYSYWHNYKVLGVGIALKKYKQPQIPIISRVHGYDLYNERAKRGARQPFKQAYDSFLSRVYFASKAGHDYYINTFGKTSGCDYVVSRLGVYNPHHITDTSKKFDLSLVSVSNVIPLKRIELIIDALALISDYSVQWVHFGGGPCFSVLQQRAKEKLGTNPNISYSLLGPIQNSEIIKYYKEHEIDAFITTTATEGGCPVSIQEAFSFGIPVIGTAIGGIPEMIDDEINGVLLSANPSPLDVKLALDALHEVKRNSLFEKLKLQAYLTWSKKFDAKQNFKKFAEDLYTLTEKY